MLHINGLSLRMGERLLLDAATVHIPAGQKVGVVGRNGTGKSTLLKAILGKIESEAGDIRIRPRAKIGTVAQEAPGGKTSPVDFVLAADHEFTSLMTEAETATDPHRIADIHDRLNDIDAHSAPARASAILAGLGFSTEAQARPLQSFSGGWRMRVALAAVLFTKPDLLLLDEPSNHLDLEARLWLEAHLAAYQGTLFLISHDRAMLNAICTAILHLDNRKLYFYKGNYDAYDVARRESRRLQAAAYAKQLEQRRHIMEFVERFRAKASKARQAQSRLKSLARMEALQPLASDEEVAFDFPAGEQLSPPILVVEDAEAGYDPKSPILTKLNLRIDMDDRIALLGANGNGKTTLLKTLAGDLKPLTGSTRKSSKLRVGYFAQEQSDSLPLNLTPTAYMQDLMRDATETAVRSHLGRFGLSQQKGETAIGKLSGGEKAKLALAAATRKSPQLLLLDEPTNHLDIDSREALTAALAAFEGATILVSHDADLINACADRLWLVADGTCSPFDGDLDDYRSLLLDSKKRQGNSPKSATAAARKEERRQSATSRASKSDLTKNIQTAEVSVEKLTAEIAALETKLADPSLYASDKTKLFTLQKNLADLRQHLEIAESAWIKAQEALEISKSLSK